MSGEFDLGPNRTRTSDEVFSVFAGIRPNLKPEPGAEAVLYPEDKIALEELERERKERNDRDAAIILRNLRLEDPNSPFPPEEF